MPKYTVRFSGNHTPWPITALNTEDAQAHAKQTFPFPEIEGIEYCGPDPGNSEELSSPKIHRRSIALAACKSAPLVAFAKWRICRDS